MSLESDHSNDSGRVLPSFDSVDGFKTWAESQGVRVSSDSPRDIDRLYGDIRKGETTLVWSGEAREWHRFSASANVDVFYTAKDGTKYKAREVRGRLKPGKTFADFLQDHDAITLSSARNAVSSLSERLHLSDSEEPTMAAVRALREEILDHAHLADTVSNAEIAELLVPGETYDNVRPADSLDSSYKGIASVVKTHKFSIELSPDSSIVIPVDASGVPNPLHEVDEAKGYVNEFVWDRI